MELIIENLSKQGFKKVVKALEPKVASVYMDMASDTITVILLDSENWCIHTTAETTTIYRDELVVGDNRRRVVLKNSEFSRVIIQ